jgi:chemotaxis protein histidine kinase CheA
VSAQSAPEGLAAEQQPASSTRSSRSQQSAAAPRSGSTQLTSAEDIVNEVRAKRARHPQRATDKRATDTEVFVPALLDSELQVRARSKAARDAEKKEAARKAAADKKELDELVRIATAAGKQAERDEVRAAKEAEKRERQVAVEAEKEAARAAKEAAADAAAFESMMARLAPSDQSGATGPRAFLELISACASIAADKFPEDTKVLTPLQAIDEPTASLQALSRKWREAFARAWEAARNETSPKSKRIAFQTSLGLSTRDTYLAFCEVLTSAGCSADDCEGACPALWEVGQGVLETYIMLNEPVREDELDPSPIEPIGDEARGVVYYMAGWAAREELARTYRHASKQVPLVQALLHDPGEPLPDDEAVRYVESRELWGGLLRVRMAVLDWFIKVEMQLRRFLTMDGIQRLRGLVIDRAASAIVKDKAITADFLELVAPAIKTHWLPCELGWQGA